MDFFMFVCSWFLRVDYVVFSRLFSLYYGEKATQMRAI